MFHRGVFKVPPNQQAASLHTLPAVVRYFYDQITSTTTNENVRVFIAKLVLNCPEVFKPFAAAWLPILLTYVSSDATALTDSGGLSSLGIDLCLLLGDWGQSGIVPANDGEKTSARTLLAGVLRKAWIAPADEESTPQATQGLPEGVAYAQKLNLELFRFLVESWIPAGVKTPYG